jgi:glycosyltransferase involved in cell wall biosynthesis
VDLSVFAPADQRDARAQLGLPDDAVVLLFAAAQARQSLWKDYDTLRAALGRVAATLRDRHVLCIVLGDSAPTEVIGRAEVRFVSYQHDRTRVAKHYAASDVYVHAARAETWGLAITEAMACGIPVVASAVGGVPEQVEDGSTGFLVPSGDSHAMASRVVQIVENRELHRRISMAATVAARGRFGLERQASFYLQWYREIIDRPIQERHDEPMANEADG